MAITEPSFGSDSAAITTTAVKDGDEYVLNGEKIYVTSGERADSVVVWATLDKSLGRAAIKSFVVEKGTPGMRVERLEHKLGIRASDTAVIIFEDCRVPAENLLGSADVDPKQRFACAMAKAEAGRISSDVRLRCVELAGTFGYSETELRGKWGRDSKILDIFERTQQIQQLIVARRILGLTSAELK